MNITNQWSILCEKLYKIIYTVLNPTISAQHVQFQNKMLFALAL